MIPSDIQLTLRQTKGSPLTHDETDADFQALKDAILAIAASLTSAGGRVVFGPEPAIADRTNTFWVPSDFRAIYAWDGTGWIRMSNRKLYAVATNIGNAYSLTLAAENKIPDLASIVGFTVFAKIPATNSGASTLKLNTFAVTPITAFAAALKSGAMQSGETCAFVYDGTNFNLLNAKGAFEDYVVPVVPSPVPTMVVDPSSPWTVPAGITKIRVTLVGGGGGGGGSQLGQNVVAGDGGDGASLTADCTVAPGQEIVFTTGAGGAGGVGASDGAVGSNTVANYFSSSWVLTAGAGAGGKVGSAGYGDQGAGGTASSSGAGILAINAKSGRRGSGSFRYTEAAGAAGVHPGEGGQGAFNPTSGATGGAGANGQVTIEY